MPVVYIDPRCDATPKSKHPKTGQIIAKPAGEGASGSGEYGGVYALA